MITIFFSSRKLRVSEQDTEHALRIAAVRACLNSVPGLGSFHTPLICAEQLNDEIDLIDEFRVQKFINIDDLKSAVFPMDQKEVRTYVCELVLTLISSTILFSIFLHCVFFSTPFCL